MIMTSNYAYRVILRTILKRNSTDGLIKRSLNQKCKRFAFVTVFTTTSRKCNCKYKLPFLFNIISLYMHSHFSSLSHGYMRSRHAFILQPHLPLMVNTCTVRKRQLNKLKKINMQSIQGISKPDSTCNTILYQDLNPKSFSINSPTFPVSCGLILELP